MLEFKKTYIKEAERLISDLQKKIVELDNNREDKEIHYEVFRIVHSLKGGGAMFGFETSSTYAGILEDKYESIKDGENTVSQELIDITYESVGHLSNLMESELENNTELNNKHLELLQRLKSI